MTGFVSLVGAGPGDPELLTLRAVARLRAADVVFYDALLHPAVLDHAPRARHVFVGKRAGRPSITQEAIHADLIGAAWRGERVVRLKCGDPFVLGRGGEEAQALADAGVPFEVVPGLTSAIAGPALAGIPVTHRGAASGFVVVSGHAEATFGPVLDGVPANGLTLVLLMGLATRGVIAARLAARGWRHDTPAAIVQAAGLPEQATWIGTLAGLGAAPLPGAPDLPGLLVVGDAVAVASETAAFRQPAPFDSPRDAEASRVLAQGRPFDSPRDAEASRGLAQGGPFDSPRDAEASRRLAPGRPEALPANR
jgi:uroporphyrin-III C-methyltransferase/precorrin-2 dehydrogenase/sirohydrochlorin ferrochelatase